MTTGKQTKNVLMVAAVAIGILGFTAGTAKAQDTVHSFRMNLTVSGDVPAGDNLNGLQITGQVGNWANIAVTLTGGKSSATDDGVTLEFDLTGAGAGWGGTSGNRGTHLATAIRVHSGIGTADIPWTLTGLEPNATYSMIWYNKNLGETRAPNTGVAGFDAGNGVGASAPHDADYDQNFVDVPADGTGTISGTWFYAGGLQGLTAVAGVQVWKTGGAPPATPGTLIYGK